MCNVNTMHVTGRYLEKEDFTLLHINGFASVTSNYNNIYDQHFLNRDL